MTNEQLQEMLGGPVIFGKPLRIGPRGWLWRRSEAHLWCADCTRTFPNGLVRLLERRPTCPYADCRGAISSRAHAWSAVRAEHPNYPLHPNMWVQYVCPPWSKPYRHPGSSRASTAAASA